MPKLLWFRQDRDEAAILDALTRLAAQHGYTNRAGPKPGAGNVAELLVAIATGEVKLLLPPDEQQTLAAGTDTGPQHRRYHADNDAPIRKLVENSSAYPIDKSV